VAIAVISGLIAYFGFIREVPLDVTAVTLTRGRVEQTVSAIASGTVKPGLDSTVAANYLGKVKSVPVKEGDRVQEGDVLVELDHADLDAQVQLAEANLRAGMSKLEQAKIAAKIYEEVAKTKVSQATAQMDLAKTDYERVMALKDQKAVSQSEVDKLSLALRVAQENTAAALASQQETMVRQEEIRSAEAGIEQLQASISVAKEAREKAIIRAPFAGIVAKLPLDVGEAVNPGIPAAILVQDNGFYVKAPFDEANAAQIRKEQVARVTLDAYRGAVFPGKVSFISPIVALNADLSRTLDIDVKIEQGQEKLTSGMSADVVLLADAKDNVLFVPSEALIREETAYVIENGRAVERKVKPGIGNFLNKEVLEGLNEGETLITSVTVKGLKDGVKVRVVDELAE
jgi:HlyD family secretion protein